VSVQALQALLLWRQTPAVGGKGGARHRETAVGATSASGFAKECGVFGYFWAVRGGETAFCRIRSGSPAPVGGRAWPLFPLQEEKRLFFAEGTLKTACDGVLPDSRPIAVPKRLRTCLPASRHPILKGQRTKSLHGEPGLVSGGNAFWPSWGLAAT